MEGVDGKLFYYYKDPYNKVPVFMTGTGKRCVLWMGGQAESFFTICYFEELAKQLDGEWCFAQVELPSSHIGYGAQDHEIEAEDMDDLIGTLVSKYGVEEVALFATSTGVQVALQLMRAGNNVHTISRVMLHGVVCSPDRPLFTEKGTAARTERVAQLMAEGRREDSQAMAKHYDIVITPARLSRGGFPTLQEALWQPALKEDQKTCVDALGALTVPTLIMLAKDIQYNPSLADVEKVKQMAQRAAGCLASDVHVEMFRDTCDEHRRLLRADINAHVQAIKSFLQTVDDKRLALEEKAKADAEEAERLKRSTLNQKLAVV